MPETAGTTLTSPLSEIHGIGPKRAASLATLGLVNVGRLLAYLPSRHERLEAEGTIDQLVPGQNVSTRGEITATRIVNRRPKPRFEAVMLDETGRLDLVWFNQLYLRDKIHPGTHLRVQ